MMPNERILKDKLAYKVLNQGPLDDNEQELLMNAKNKREWHRILRKIYRRRKRETFIYGIWRSYVNMHLSYLSDYKNECLFRDALDELGLDYYRIWGMKHKDELKIMKKADKCFYKETEKSLWSGLSVETKINGKKFAKFIQWLKDKDYYDRL